MIIQFTWGIFKIKRSYFEDSNLALMTNVYVNEIFYYFSTHPLLHWNVFISCRVLKKTSNTAKRYTVKSPSNSLPSGNCLKLVRSSRDSLFVQKHIHRQTFFFLYVMITHYIDSSSCFLHVTYLTYQYIVITLFFIVI